LSTDSIDSKPYRAIGLCVGLLACAPLALGAEAQPAPAGATGVAAVTEESPRLGIFVLQPSAELNLLYDSNIYSERSDPTDDTILMLAPRVTAATDWERHRLGWSAGALVGRYASEEDEDYADWWLDAEGRYDLDDATHLFGGLGYAFAHEDRGSPSELVAGDEPTTFGTLEAHAGVGHDFGPAALRLGGTFEKLDFDDAGNLDNDIRDREQTGLGGRVTWPLNETLDAYAQVIYDHRSYDEAASSGRDSSGYQAGGGLVAKLTNRLHAELYVGQIDQDYDDPVYDTVRTLDYGGELSWLPGRTTRVELSLDRTLEETTLAGSSSYLYTAFDASVLHRLVPGVTVHGGLGVARAAYQDVDRDDDYYTAEAGLRYALSRQWYLGASYRISQRDSSERVVVLNSADLRKTEDFDRELVWFTLGADFGGDDAGWPAETSGPPLLGLGSARGWGGPYAGLALTHDLLGFETTGTRSGGIDTGPYAGADAGVGAFLGYGFASERWYLGIEAEAMDSDADFAHYKDKLSSRRYAGSAAESYAFSLRPGFVAGDGSLIYLRLGYIDSNFDLAAGRNDEPFNAFDDEVDADGWRYGYGVDIPASERLFVRLDFSHSDYDDFDVDLVSESENWEPRRDLFQVGLGWRFGGGGREPDAPFPVPPSGPYGGALLVRSDILSEADGVHNEANPPPGGSFDYYGEFGRGEFSGGGAFVGYRWSLGRWLLALEGELDAGDAGWRHVRTVGGRNFSVKREGSRELALRGGYRLDNGTELYLRAGRVWTRFGTTWTKGDTRSNDVARDDDVRGTRLGLGADVSLSPRVYARFEYAYTEYDSYDFSTVHGQSDEMDFDNSEGVFRVGLGVRM